MRIRAVEDFGTIARQRRRDLGLSQEELADRVGVTRQWLVRFEKGNSTTTLAKAFAVLSELDLVTRVLPRGSDSVSQGVKFTIPKIELSNLDMESLRRSLNSVQNDSIKRMVSQMQESLHRIDASRQRSIGEIHD